MRAHSPPSWAAAVAELEGAPKGAHNQGTLEGSLDKTEREGSRRATTVAETEELARHTVHVARSVGRLRGMGATCH